MRATVNSEVMRRTNRGLVFKNLVSTPDISRSELAQKLGLTKMTITNIVAELLEKGIVIEKEKKILGKPHKNPIGLDLSPNCPRIIGVQIQRDYCRTVLCDCRLNILDGTEVRFEKISLESLKDALDTTVGKMMEYGNVLGIGIGSVGPIDVRRGVICNPPNFGDIHDFGIVDFVKEKFHVPVRLEHHYSCAALAEFYFGDCRDVQKFLYLGITKGVGMAGIVNGQPYNDFFRKVPEIGHISVDYQGRPCWCGNRGCLEQYVSTNVISEELNEITGLDKFFREYCKMTDSDIIDSYFRNIMDILKTGLVSGINLFGPDTIIIGDEGRYFPEKHLKYLEKEINNVHLYRNQKYISVQTSGIEKDVFVASPAMGILDRIFKGELEVDAA